MQISQGNVRWLAAALGYPTLLHLAHLPWISVFVLTVSVLAAYLLATRLHGRTKLSASTVAALALAGLLLTQLSWRSGEAILTLIAMVGWLKLAELRSSRDGVLVWVTALWSLGMVPLWVSPGAALILVPPGLMLQLVALATLSAKKLFIGRITRTLILALPITAALFVFTPRITGDLGVLSFALGIPLIIETQAEKQRDPMRDGLAMGDLADRAQNDMRVLVATFFGGSGKFYNGPPPLGDLYWRGPVLWTYENGEWRGRDGWHTRTARMRGKITHKTLDRELRETGKIAVYDVTLFPHRGYWLYSMDFPAAVPPSSFITRDYQLQNLNPVRELLKYPMMSYVDYRAGQELDAETRALALQLPIADNPRTLAHGRALRTEHADPVAIAKAGIAWFSENYAYDRRFAGYNVEHPVDAFVFDRREGFASHFATAYALMMRAAGIPTRIVVGYRGGIHLGLTNRVYVIEDHVHAWTEIWLDQYGWVRMDPAAAYAKAADKEVDGWGLGAAMDGDAAKQEPVETEGFEAADPETLKSEPVVSSEPVDGQSWWTRWITEFDSGQQIGLLAALDLAPRWQNLMALAVAFAAFLTGLLFVARWAFRFIAARQRSAAVRLEDWACRIAAKGYEPRQPAEALTTFLSRIAAHRIKPAAKLQRYQALSLELRKALFEGGELRADWAPEWKQLFEAARRAIGDQGKKKLS